MKLSILIKELTDLLSENGDRQVVLEIDSESITTHFRLSFDERERCVYLRQG